MDKKSKTLLILLVVLTAVSVGYTFYKTVVKEDFEIVNTQPIEDTTDAAASEGE